MSVDSASAVNAGSAVDVVVNIGVNVGSAVDSGDAGSVVDAGDAGSVVDAGNPDFDAPTKSRPCWCLTTPSHLPGPGALACVSP